MQFARPRRSRATWLIAVMTAATIPAAGCPQTVYEIDMSVDGQTVLRSLKAGMRRDDDGPATIPPEEDAHLAEVYGKPTAQDKQGRTTIEGEFLSKLPDDVGGHGETAHWQTSLGSLSVYLERFRGNDDLQATLTERLTQIDAAVDLLHGWIDSAAPDTAAGQKLWEFVDTDFRRDIKNVWLIYWTSNPTVHRERPDADRNMLEARILQYGLEHGYVELADIPQWHNSVGTDGFTKFRRLIAHRLGYSDFSMKELVPALESQDAFRESFDEFLNSSPHYRTFLRHNPWLVGYRQTPTDNFYEFVARTAGLPGFGIDRVNARLHLPVQPFATNGEWIDDDHVEWAADIAVRDKPPLDLLPTLHYAAWSEPAAEFQETHFGRILLSGKPLADYVLWRQALSQSVTPKWDYFLENLSSTDDLKQRLIDYRNSLPADSPEQVGCNLLEAAL